MPPFADVGGDFGATSTMLVEYLRAARLEPTPEVATALFYGIKADTRDLGRRDDADRTSTATCGSSRASTSSCWRRSSTRSCRRGTSGCTTRRSSGRRCTATAIITDLGEVYSPDMVAEVAERMMFLEDMQVVARVRQLPQPALPPARERPADERGPAHPRSAQDRGGSAGGHGSMAGARLPLYGTRQQRKALKREVVRRFKEALGVDRERGVAVVHRRDVK